MSVCSMRHCLFKSIVLTLSAMALSHCSGFNQFVGDFSPGNASGDSGSESYVADVHRTNNSSETSTEADQDAMMPQDVMGTFLTCAPLPNDIHAVGCMVSGDVPAGYQIDDSSSLETHSDDGSERSMSFSLINAAGLDLFVYVFEGEQTDFESASIILKDEDGIEKSFDVAVDGMSIPSIDMNSVQGALSLTAWKLDENSLVPAGPDFMFNEQWNMIKADGNTAKKFGSKLISLIMSQVTSKRNVDGLMLTNLGAQSVVTAGSFKGPERQFCSNPNKPGAYPAELMGMDFMNYAFNQFFELEIKMRPECSAQGASQQNCAAAAEATVNTAFGWDNDAQQLIFKPFKVELSGSNQVQVVKILSKKMAAPPATGTEDVVIGQMDIAEGTGVKVKLKVDARSKKAEWYITETSSSQGSSQNGQMSSGPQFSLDGNSLPKVSGDYEFTSEMVTVVNEYCQTSLSLNQTAGKVQLDHLTIANQQLKGDDSDD